MSRLRRTAPAVSLLLLATSAAAQAGPSDAGPSEAEAPARSYAEPSDVLPELVELLRAGLDRTEPHYDARPLEGDTLFRGNFDWHSSVHAHWALLCIARVTEDAGLVAELLARLSPAALAAERAVLADPRNAGRMLPYGQAWLTLLLAELGRHAERDTPELRAFRREVEERVLGWLEERELDGRPIGAERDGPVVPNANYGSWLFVYWLLALSEPAGEDGAARLERLWQERVAPARAALAGGGDSSAYDFVHLPSLLHMLELDRGEAPGEGGPAGVGALPEEVTYGEVHLLGYEISRTWPWALEAGRGSGEARARYRERTAAYLLRRDCWAEDFRVVTHWVPQFLWMGIWLERGRP